MKNTGTRIFNLRRVLFALAVALVGGSALAVTAQIDASAVATQATADITGVFEDALPVLTAAIGLMIGWKYLKRFFLGV